MTKYCIQIILLIFINQLCGQNLPTEYKNLTKKADSLYEIKNYKYAALLYSKAFATLRGMGRVKDRFSAACSWALADYPDSAFYQLEKIASKGFYCEHEKLTKENALNSIHDNPRWKPVLEKMQHNQDSIEANMDKKLIVKLDSLEREDQKWRNYLTKLHNREFHNDSVDPKTILPNMAAVDRRNGIEVRKIFFKYGFPNYDLVGTRGSSNFWLLVQHQDSDPKFQDSVLTAMKIEAEKGKASLIDYAYLIDRVKLNTGEKQIYGTQMQLNSDGTSYKTQPVIEPEKLNERRALVGLDTIEEYIKLINNQLHGYLKKK
jgi:hypothetical protein